MTLPDTSNRDSNPDLPAIHAVMKQAMFPLTIALSASLANVALRSGATDVSAPMLIPRAGMLPNPHRIYVANTTVRAWNRDNKNGFASGVDIYSCIHTETLNSS